MKVADCVTECNVKDLIQMFNKLSCSSNNPTSPVVRNVSHIKNTPCAMTAKNNYIGQRAYLHKKSGLLNELPPQPIENKKLPESNVILSETYKKCSAHPEGIKSSASNDIGLLNVKLSDLTKDHSSWRDNLQVNGERVHSLSQVADSDYNSRTLGMLVNARILHKDIIIEKFDTLNEDILTRKIINEKIDTLNIRERDESSIIKIENSVHEAFSTLKSDSFIKEWLRSGYSTKKEHENCISILGDCINFRSSNLSGRSLYYIDFGKIDLSDSSFDNCHIYKCDFSKAVLDGVTMNNTEIEDCNGYRDANHFVVRQLIAQGVEGLNPSDYIE